MFITRKLCLVAVVSAFFVLPSHGQENPESDARTLEGSINLGQALAKALDQNPDLAPYPWDVRAAEARAIQAGLRPNPTLSLELEGIRIGGSSGTQSRSNSFAFSPQDGILFDTSQESESRAGGALSDLEATLTFSQLVELGGKRARRIAAADTDRDVVLWDYEVARADVLAATARKFYAVIAAQEELVLAEQLFELAFRTHTAIETLVDGGKISVIEKSRSQIELSQLQITRNEAERTLRAARVALAGQWGSRVPHFTEALGTLSVGAPLPSIETVRAAIDASPYLVRWNKELDRREAVVALERANGKPDVTVTFGIRSAASSGTSSRGRGVSRGDGVSLSRGSSGSARDTQILLGFSVPLPLFNRNQGRIKEAEYLAAKTSFERAASAARFTNALQINYERAQAILETLDTVQETLIPTAEEVFGSIQEGHRAGKFSLLDVLVAQRSLFDAHRQRIESQAEYLQVTVDIERFTGLALASTSELDDIDVVESK